eukprot:GEMP01037723.1.p1 GENE.GEMP01037723.1~~GEMP01037723.1.p1  ORF type:complete len:239 (+),score=37.81 GEMP01037723.1:143-859(+)
MVCHFVFLSTLSYATTATALREVLEPVAEETSGALIGSIRRQLRSGVAVIGNAPSSVLGDTDRRSMAECLEPGAPGGKSAGGYGGGATKPPCPPGGGGRPPTTPGGGGGPPTTPGGGGGTPTTTPIGGGGTKEGGDGAGRPKWDESNEAAMAASRNGASQENLNAGSIAGLVIASVCLLVVFLFCFARASKKKGFQEDKEATMAQDMQIPNFSSNMKKMKSSHGSHARRNGNLHRSRD